LRAGSARPGAFGVVFRHAAIYILTYLKLSKLLSTMLVLQ